MYLEKIEAADPRPQLADFVWAASLTDAALLVAGLALAAAAHASRGLADAILQKL